MTSNTENNTVIQRWPTQQVLLSVEAVEELATDIYQVVLGLPSARNDLGFHAGQYLEIILDQGSENELSIPYSIASAPGTNQVELHVMHQGEGTLSERVINEFKQQSQVLVNLAKGDCIFDPQALNEGESVLLIAAGTCFGQMKAMLEQGVASAKNLPIHLYWGVREAEQLYFQAMAERWAAENPQVSFTAVVSEPGADWPGRKGLVHEAVLADIADLSSFQVYVCGSPAMVYAVEDAFTERGLREGCIHSDVFSYAPRPKKD